MDFDPEPYWRRLRVPVLARIAEVRASLPPDVVELPTPAGG